MKVTIKGYITYNKEVWDDKASYGFSEYDPAKYGLGVIVMEHSFEVEVPDNFDPRPGQIAALKAQKEKVQAEFSKRVMEIDEQINNLLAISA